ncbi:MAG: glycerophosphodiester phosphodiesterase family protein [Trinickia sp.]|uniref:glycerophosphodiester phosphodiesterase family protein n=1 Tax=Trinickia sp. TaxID=2571163 RepID=UPI003F8125E9
MKNIAEFYTLHGHHSPSTPPAAEGKLPAPPSRPIPGQTAPSRGGLLDRLSARGQPAVGHRPILESGPPLVEYPSSAAPRNSRALGKLLVPLSGEFSEQAEATLTAHRITLQAVQTKFAKTGTVRALPGNHPLARFSAGKLDHVLVDEQTFSKLARAAGRSMEGDPHRFPVFLDSRREALVVDTSRAFSGDELTPAALQGIGRAFRTHDAGIPDDAWRPATAPAPASRKLDPGKKRGNGQSVPASTKPNGAPPRSEPSRPWPVRHRNALHLEYPYPGREVGSTSRGADFYKADVHHGIADLEGWANAVRPSFAHANYFDDPNNAGYQDIAVHRGLIDNHNGIPENSIAAIDNAFEHGYQSVEIDVAVTADEVPVLLHDFTAGRMTADPDNRLISHIPSTDLLERNLVIRNPVNGDYVTTDQKVPSVQQALEHILAQHPGKTVMLDCKETSADMTVALLIDKPHLRSMTAVKLYGQAYSGGFDQLLGNLMRHYGISPTRPEHRERRERLRADLKEIKFVPIMPQKELKNPELLKYYPQPGVEPGQRMKPEQIAQLAMDWLDSWQGAKPVLLQVVQSKKETPEGKAMEIVRDRLRDPSHPYSKLPFAFCYRYEDFSAQPKGERKGHYYWSLHGRILDAKREGEFGARRGTAGAFRHAAQNLLTDQPDEEVWAIAHDRQLDRGHSGFEVQMPPGAKIDTNFAAESARVREWSTPKVEPDQSLIEDVRAGAAADRRHAAKS